MSTPASRLETRIISRSSTARWPRKLGLKRTIRKGVAFEYEVSSLMTTREAHDRFQQEVDHILDDLKRNP
jgi:hypothetical protein